MCTKFTACQQMALNASNIIFFINYLLPTIWRFIFLFVLFRYMLGAVSAHKLVIAFCVGVELIATRTKTWLSIVYITTFAVVSPLGIGIGLLLVGGEGATAAGVYSVVLQGLASGTLLYVIFFEIWKGDRSGILQFIASVIGFFVMFGLQMLSK